MKTIVNISKTELQKLFYSPVPWLILIIFAFQGAMSFNALFEGSVRAQSLGRGLNAITLNIYAGMFGFFTNIQGYLFLYIPLVTMNIMSREFSSGSIKQLYSSPITNFQIVLGKYLSLVAFGVAFIGVLGVFGLYGTFGINNADWPVIFCGLFGLFLVVCAYSAVGLFMSTLTSYPVVAAMGTLGVLAALNYVRGIGQEIEFVRDITYWLAISGRADTFIAGLITTDDVLYFLIVIAMFLGFTIVKLMAGRQRTTWGGNFGRYAGVFLVAGIMGYFSAQPRFMGYWDVTQNKSNTLTKASQEVMSKLKSDLTITTYTNMLEPNYGLALPQSFKYDYDRFKMYTRFKPEIKLKYVYYYHNAENEHLDRQYPLLNAEQRYDTLRKINNWKFKVVPYSEIADQVDLSAENYRFVRELKTSDGKKTFLRVFDDMQRLPSEAEISAAMKPLVMELPVVGFVYGHGERESHNAFDRGYKMFAQEKTFRYALINQGFAFKDVLLDKPVDEKVNILVIAEPKRLFSDNEQANLDAYVARGGNLLIMGEPGRQEYTNPVVAPFGITFMDGVLVKPNNKFQANLMTLKASGEGTAFSHYLNTMNSRRYLLTMPTAGGMVVDKTKGFEVTTLFTSDSTGSWNEIETTDFIDDSASFNGDKETMTYHETVVALSRKINNREQKIVVTSDADWVSNGELGLSRKGLPAGNFYLISAAFSWLTDGEAPIDMRREPFLDRKMNVSEKAWTISNILLKWVFPGVLILVAVLLLTRRKGR